MWHQVEQSITAFLGYSFKIKQKRPVAGGDISKAFVISDGTKQFFVKVNDLNFVDNFNCEAESLKHISHTNTIATPKVIEVGVTKAHAFIILSFIDFIQPTNQMWYQAGIDLAKLHLSSTQPMFGFEENNFIGHTPQYNRWQSNWSTFFAEQRIGYQLELLAEQNVYIADIDEIVGIIHNLLKPRKTPACLVHGDLWRGNLGFGQDKAYIYDPACYYADYETDLAMTELFGCFPEEFYVGYRSLNAIEEGYQTRKQIYNFYHILNHANLFSGQYITQAKQRLVELTKIS